MDTALPSHFHIPPRHCPTLPLEARAPKLL
jgi:hypothetical protein